MTTHHSDKPEDEEAIQEDGEEELTPTKEQEDALEIGHHVSITAGAGTGKTFTLTERYLHILEETDATPEEIVTITFTNDAANELQDRIREVASDRLNEAVTDETDYERWRAIKDDLEEGYLHTIHGFCARILREFLVDAPVRPDFEVYDEADSTALAQRVTRCTVGDLLHLLESPDTSTPDAVSESPVDRETAIAAVRRLTRLWNRSTLEDTLVGLLDSRPASEEWAEEWVDAAVDDYEEFVWEIVHPLTDEIAMDLLADQAVRDALTTIQSLHADGVLHDIDPDDDDGAETIYEICRLMELHEPLAANTESRAKQQFLDELCDYLTTNDGTRDGRDWKYRGSKSRWESAGWEQEQAILFDAIDELFAALEPGDLTFGMDSEAERVSGAYVIALARIFSVALNSYEQAKDKQNALDYEDLIRKTTAFIDSTPRVHDQLNSQFKYLMVDEMQDTDPRQWKLIQLIAGLSDDSPVAVTPSNVFAVGDEKQSIYRFRGADVTTFGKARDDLCAENPDAAETELELSGSFRTLEETLTFCNEFFDRVFEPLNETYTDYEAQPQTLNSERIKGTDLAGTCEYLFVPDDDYQPLHGEGYLAATPQSTETGEREAYSVATRLTRLLANPPDIYDEEAEEYRDAEPHDITIMLRSRTRLKAYERTLDAYDIPYTVVSGTGFYDAPEITAVINLLRVLEDPQNDLVLYGVLRSPLFGFTDNILAQLRLIDEGLWTAMESIATGDASLPHNNDNPEAESRLTLAYETLDQWRRMAGTHPDIDADATTPWATLLTEIIDDTGLIASVAGDERPRQAAANLNRIREQLRNWEEAGLKTLSELLARLDRARELGGHTAEATIPEDTDGVQIRTIHSAKGLEYPIVVVPELGTEFNFQADIDGNGKVYFEELDYPGADDRVPGVGIKSPTPDDAFASESTLVRTVTKELADQRERAELKRVLYVAMTRTRDHLILSGIHEIEDDGSEYELADVNDADSARCWRDWVQPVLCDDSLLEELAKEGSAERELGEAEYNIIVPQPPVTDWEYAQIVDTPPLNIEIPSPPAFEKSRVTTATAYAKSQTDSAEETYLEDEGSSDEEEDRDEITELQRNTFGTIVHRICEVRPPETRWASFARSIAQQEDEHITDDDIMEIREHANRAITFVNEYEADLSIQSSHDELAVVARFGNTRMVGEIDHLAVSPDTFHIIDYKTNDLTNQSLEALQESYLPQLQAYAVALHQDDPSRTVSATLYFTDAASDYTITLEPSELIELESEIGRNLTE